ncbi:MAG: motility associated factor glycosyltransferase family protein [Spirochaetes bacterium]|nr:motility associated factor glycosyltransferase family protein [Spirochaetota bacterium]
MAERNMAVLARRFPALREKLAGLPDDENVEAVETPGGDFVPSVTAEGGRIFVHSRFDPVKEAERFIGGIDAGTHDLFVIFGFGFGYHVERLLAGMGADSIALVIERNPYMLHGALSKRDLERLLGDERLILLLDPREEDIAESLRGRSSRRSTLITHRGSFRTDPDYYGNLQGIVRSYLSTKEVNIATLAKFEKVWASNIARNIGVFAVSPGAGTFYGTFEGIPAIVAAAGPSLLESLDFLRANRDSAVIVAVDTSYRILRRNGIEPHFCLVVDPQAVNARYFEGASPGSTILVADPMVHPSVFRFFKGRVAVTGVAFDLLRWIERCAGEKGEIAHGGSVSTNAYDFARRLGASPVILVGQDLAFTGGYAHARGSYLDEQVHLRTRRFQTAEMFNRFQLTALPKIFVRGIRGGTVHTNQKMMIFLSWFEKRRDAGLVNATADGAMIPGVEQMRADEIVLPTPAEAIDRRIDKLYRAAAEKVNAAGAVKGLGKKVGFVLGEIESLIPVLERAVGFSDTLLTLMNAKEKGGGAPVDEGKVGYLLKKLSDADGIVESKTHAKEMISITIQRVVHTITEGHDIDEGDRNLGDEVLVAKRSRYLYRGLLEGARFNIKILKKMAMILDRG